MSIDLQRHRSEPIDAEDARCSRAEVDHAPGYVWATVVYSHRHRAAVTLVDDGDPAAHRERFVGGRHGVGVHVFTVRGDAVVVDRCGSLQAAVVVGVHQMEFSVAVEIRQLGSCGRSDLKSCREHARERCCESGGLDRTTMHCVLISQTVLPFVCLTCRSDMPISERAKDVPLTHDVGSAMSGDLL